MTVDYSGPACYQHKARCLAELFRMFGAHNTKAPLWHRAAENGQLRSDFHLTAWPVASQRTLRQPGDCRREEAQGRGYRGRCYGEAAYSGSTRRTL